MPVRARRGIRNVNPDQPPLGHSAIDAMAKAQEIVEDVDGRLSAVILTMGDMFDLVKLSVMDEDNNHLLDVECSARDASLILAELGMTGANDIGDIVATFINDGMNWDEARQAAGLIATSHDA
jgi:hypothetical protein